MRRVQGKPGNGAAWRGVSALSIEGGTERDIFGQIARAGHRESDLRKAGVRAATRSCIAD